MKVRLLSLRRWSCPTLRIPNRLICWKPWRARTVLPLYPKHSKVIVDYTEKLTVLQYALSQYTYPQEGEDIPESVIEAFVEKIVVSKDGFDWYLRFDGDPNKPRRCTLEGKRRTNTKVVVSQDFSPALDSSTTGCNQGLISKPYNPLTFGSADFLWELYHALG